MQCELCITEDWNISQDVEKVAIKKLQSKHVLANKYLLKSKSNKLLLSLIENMVCAMYVRDYLWCNRSRVWCNRPN